MSRPHNVKSACVRPVRLLAAAGLASALTLSATMSARAQTAATTSGPIISTTVPPESRVEVVPAPEWLGVWLRVDKFLGRAAVLRRTDAGQYLIYPMRPAEFGVILPDRPNYQLYIPGTDDGAVFLVSLHTGAVWLLTTDGPAGELTWRQVDESTNRARGYRR